MQEDRVPSARVENNALMLEGEWTIAQFSRVQHALSQLNQQDLTDLQSLSIDKLHSIDCSAATELMVHVSPKQILALSNADHSDNTTPELTQSRARHVRLLHTVAESLDAEDSTQPRKYRFGDGLARFGQWVSETTQHQWQQTTLLLSFIGLTLVRTLTLIFLPHRWRITSFFVHVQQAGLQAIPIVALLTFLVGAVVAFLGATVLQDFGATIYTVDLVAYAFMRELGVLLAAILLAGRTASSFTAQIGAMKVNQEVDALRVQGIDPIEVLVIPRLLALLIMLPLLTFVGIVSGIVGGMMVAAISLDISVAQFLRIVQEIPERHLYLGLAKAPIFAAVIAIIGCLEGFKVKGNARSVGEHTTSSVVQAIFIVILLNAIAALFFMEMGW
ncbi:MlaE family ABC transporter permease [Aliidiomarina indica]|uniref:MlaE family ABC transporter permease n=1 Tax=Aliidiomarina indica TaxID=2749147 RepID=UPI001E621477|nr:ABC transporter permease [Aliidiomarina indica]